MPDNKLSKIDKINKVLLGYMKYNTYLCTARMVVFPRKEEGTKQG